MMLYENLCTLFCKKGCAKKLYRESLKVFSVTICPNRVKAGTAPLRPYNTPSKQRDQSIA
jgi:hypothetical protein